ncbi:MAG: hypothetical protein K0U20_09270 [Proteobacteria bacterium]|nr:hypothetical protein [Pseudomonadota bacterium]MCH9735770.1 hypothetical protein [Actinomycetes bacterium]
MDFKAEKIVIKTTGIEKVTLVDVEVIVNPKRIIVVQEYLNKQTTFNKDAIIYMEVTGKRYVS